VLFEQFLRMRTRLRGDGGSTEHPRQLVDPRIA
jgi:hypothetical protein